MSNLFGVDYAWGRPSITSLKNAGVQFACRYLSHDTTGKNLDRAEAVRLGNAGIWIVVVWESTASRALAGRAAGVADAKDAIKQAKAAGMPGDRPIYFAVDFDASSGQQAAINAYLDGAASVLGKDRTGIYSGYHPVKRALDGGHCTWAWQTYAWSGGKWDSRAQIRQYLNDQTIGGVGLDYDRSTKSDFGQWKVGVTPAPAPTPQPTQEDDDMPTGTMRNGKAPEDLTVEALPTGKYHRIWLKADNGAQGLKPASIRIALGKGDGGWEVHHNIVVDASKAAFSLPLPAQCDGFSLAHDGTDATKVDTVGAVNIAWAVA